jgi:hypothetical protein
MESIKDKVIISLNGQVRANASNPQVHAAVAKKVLREDDPDYEEKKTIIENYAAAYAEEVSNFLTAVRGSRGPVFN